MILDESSQITTDSWKDLARIMYIGLKSSLMQMSETAQCVTLLQPARIASETLQLSETGILTVGSRVSHIQPAPECVSCNQQTLKDVQRSK